MERIIKDIWNHKIITIFIIVTLIIFIVFININNKNKNELNKPAIKDKIIIQRLSIIYDDNIPDVDEIMEVNLNNKEFKRYIRYTYYKDETNVKNSNTFYPELNNIKIPYFGYDVYGTHKMNDTEYQKLNKLIRKISENNDEYKNMGQYYDGIPEKVAIENNKMAKDDDPYYTMYYYKICTIDKNNNFVDFGTIYKINDLKLIEYYFDMNLNEQNGY